jgi:hypothetical protein
MMRCSSIKVVAFLAACGAYAPGRMPADDRAKPSVELQSEALTPGPTLAESKIPVHQVRLLADVGRPGVSRGTLILDPNAPVFDEFGGLAGGVVTPESGGQRGPLPAVELECRIEPVKSDRGQQEWHLYRLAGPDLKSRLLLATRGPITSSGPARLLVLGKGERVEIVVALTRYGLIAP